MGLNCLLTEEVKFVKVNAAATAATSAVTTAAVDMAQDGGYEGCVFLTSFGTPATGNTVKVQQSDDDGSADAYSDLEDSETAPGASDESQFVDIAHPEKRYLKAVLTRGTSSTVDNVWAILYRPREIPVDNTTDGTITGVQLVSPDEGTA